jgi:aryl-alcohol dehydrogenase-like predicted oxidoreductase
VGEGLNEGGFVVKGTRCVEQLVENLGALDVTLSPEALQRLETGRGQVAVATRSA